MKMELWKKTLLFYVGGAGYMTLEFLWRGRSHGSMFLLGGLCFTVLGKLRRLRLPLGLRAVSGAAAITGLELLTGLALNRDYRIWDYRAMPLNYRGQICLPYSLLWLPLSVAGFFLHDRAERALTFPTEAVE